MQPSWPRLHSSKGRGVDPGQRRRSSVSQPAAARPRVRVGGSRLSDETALHGNQDRAVSHTPDSMARLHPRRGGPDLRGDRNRSAHLGLAEVGGRASGSVPRIVRFHDDDSPGSALPTGKPAVDDDRSTLGGELDVTSEASLHVANSRCSSCASHGDIFAEISRSDSRLWLYGQRAIAAGRQILIRSRPGDGVSSVLACRRSSEILCCLCAERGAAASLGRFGRRPAARGPVEARGMPRTGRARGVRPWSVRHS